MSDLISRKAILEHIEKIRQSVQTMDDTHRASTTMNGMHLCEEAVMNQPSTEPEITRCGECAHKDKKIDYCHYLGITICECDYCSYAVRRTDG